MIPLNPSQALLERISAFVFGPGRGPTVVRAVAVSAGLRFAGMALTFLVGVQLARGLGPAGYGVYGVAMSIIALLTVPGELGMPQVVMRELATANARGDRRLARRLLSTSVRTILTSAALVSVVALVVARAGRRLDPVFIWAVALLPLLTIGNLYGAALRGMQRVAEGQIPELIVRPALVSASLFILSSSLVTVMDLTPHTAMALNVGAAGIAAALAALMTRVHLSRIPESKTTGEPRDERWLSQSLPMALSEGLRILGGHIGILFLGAIAPESEVGQFRVAYGIYSAATLPSALINVACSPMIARLHEERRPDALQRLNAWISLVLVGCSTVLLLPFALLGETIVGSIFGEPFRAANTALVILLLGELASGAMGHPIIVLNMVRRERAVTLFSVMSIFVNAGCCLLFARSLGGIGIAIGAAAGQLVARFAASLYARRRLGLDTSLIAWIPGIRRTPSA